MNEMKCFLDGNCLCIVKDDFIDLMSSDAMFVDLTDKQIDEFNKLCDK